MPRPRRFTSQYGKYTRKQSAWSQYRSRSDYGAGLWSAWIGNSSDSPTLKNPTITSVRLTPIDSDFVSPTSWGAVAEFFSAPAFDYYSDGSVAGSHYHWRGEGDVTTMGAPSLIYASIGSVSSTGSSVVVSLPSGLSSAALTRARNGLANQHINLSVVFGEARESIGMLADLSVRILQSFRHARKGRWRRALESLYGGSFNFQHTAENYAGYIWGLAPMLNDAFGLQQQIKEGLSRNGKTFTSAGFASKSTVPSSFWGTYTPSTHRYGGIGGRAFSRVRYTARIKSEVLYALNQLGLANPFATAWELLPLSFVIDWFLPIGDFLSAITAPLGTEFVSGFEDRVIEVNVNCTYCRYGFTQYRGGTMQSCIWQYFAFQRLTLTSFQPPNLYIGSGLSNSVQRVISSVALIKLRAR